jgi:hypothetical protein
MQLRHSIDPAWVTYLSMYTLFQFSWLRNAMNRRESSIVFPIFALSSILKHSRMNYPVRWGSVKSEEVCGEEGESRMRDGRNPKLSAISRMTFPTFMTESIQIGGLPQASAGKQSRSAFFWFSAGQAQDIQRRVNSPVPVFCGRSYSEWNHTLIDTFLKAERASSLLGVHNPLRLNRLASFPPYPTSPLSKQSIAQISQTGSSRMTVVSRFWPFVPGSKSPHSIFLRPIYCPRGSIAYRRFLTTI